MQQINLLLPELKPKADIASTTNCLILVVLTVVMLTALHFSDKARIEKVEQKLEQTLVEEKKLRALVDLTKKISKPKDKKLLERQLEQLKKAVANRERIKEVIYEQNIGNDNGFSRYMHSMALHSFKDISLDRITFSQGGDFVEFSGLSKKPKHVPFYLDLLRSDLAFSTVKFGLISIEQAGDSNVVKFSFGYNVKKDELAFVDGSHK